MVTAETHRSPWDGVGRAEKSKGGREGHRLGGQEGPVSAGKRLGDGVGGGQAGVREAVSGARRVLSPRGDPVHPSPAVPRERLRAPPRVPAPPARTRPAASGTALPLSLTGLCKCISYIQSPDPRKVER